MTDTSSAGGSERPPRVLLLYYSYTGQSQKVLEAAGEVFRGRGAEVHEAAIEFTDQRYAERFSRFPLKRVWPDMLSVLGAQKRGETVTQNGPVPIGVQCLAVQSGQHCLRGTAEVDGYFVGHDAIA